MYAVAGTVSSSGDSNHTATRCRINNFVLGDIKATQWSIGYLTTTCHNPFTTENCRQPTLLARVPQQVGDRAVLCWYLSIERFK